MKTRRILISHTQAFSLLEILCAVTLVILLAGLVSPTVDVLRSRAQSAACASNLRQIGLAMAMKVQDNDNTFPKVEGDPANPIYPPDEGALPLGVVLQAYGVDTKTLQCPADLKAANYFQQRGSSYEWLPIIDGEISISPKIYLPHGQLQLPMSRLPLATDFSDVHRGGQNVLFADGHVRML